MAIIIPLILLSFCVQNSFEWSINPLSWFKNSKGCELDLNSDLNNDHQPLFLTKTNNGFGLSMPQLVDRKGVFSLAKGESVFIACPGGGNELRGFNKETSHSYEAKCVKNRTLHLGGRDVLSTELECKNKVGSVLKELKKPCGNSQGTEIQLGFEVEGWHPLITICFRRNHTETLYSSHQLYGSVLQGAETKRHQTYFVKGSRTIYNGVNPENAYKQANQREVLKQRIGETQANRALAHSYLSRGHLSPDADFLLGTWQDLSYFYINTAPQWQTINGGNWLKMENLIRNFAISTNKDYSVTTGTYGVLEMKDGGGFSKKIFLEPFKELLPVPQLLWKIVADTSKSSCIVLIVYNNPFLDRAPSKICTDICEENKWKQEDATNIAKGFTYCCSYPDFKRVVNHIPLLSCKSVLKNHK